MLMATSYHSTDLIDKGGSDIAIHQVLSCHRFVTEPVFFPKNIKAEN